MILQKHVAGAISGRLGIVGATDVRLSAERLPATIESAVVVIHVADRPEGQRAGSAGPP